MSLVMIPGAKGFLEVHYHRSLSAGSEKAGPSTNPVVMLVPPHPTEQGLLSHPVMYTMYHAFVVRGFDVVRFNYRGCGKSQGTFVEGECEILDAAFCWDWVCKNVSPLAPKWVGGFSLGAWVAMQILMRRPECQHFVVASTPTNSQDFNFLAPCPVPGLVVHGELDTVVPRDSVARFVQGLSSQRRGNKIVLEEISQGDHAFSQQLVPLENVLLEYIEKIMAVDKSFITQVS